MEGNKVQNYKSCFDIIGPIMVGLLLHIQLERLQSVLLRDNVFGEHQRMCDATITNHSPKRIRDTGRILRLLAEF